MALAGVELKTLVSEPNALTTRPPNAAKSDQYFILGSTYYKQQFSFFRTQVNITGKMTSFLLWARYFFVYLLIERSENIIAVVDLQQSNGCR